MDAVFLDFDGVIRHWRTEAVSKAEIELGCTTGRLFQCAFDPQRLMPAINGRVTHEAWQRGVMRALAADLGSDAARYLISAWQSATWDLDRELISDIRRRRPQSPLVLVTNATSALAADLRHSELDDCFDGVVNSSDIGVAKPEAGFFRHALKRVDARPEHSLFVDDSRTNVEAAKDLGFQTVHFENRTASWPHLIELLDRM